MSDIKNIKIAIHDRNASFSDRWIAYCKKYNIQYKRVNCYDTDIINQIKDCDGLMWHWSQTNYKEALFARQLTLSLETINIKVFPDVNTAWHFDDKLGQKYLLEAINAPLIPSYIFYSKQDANEWAKNAEFPKVFKLRSGAGSVNVKLVKNVEEAKAIIKKGFGKGFQHIDRFSRLKERIWYLRRDKNLESIRGLVSGIARLVIPTEVEKFSKNEKGYVYFQDFIPNQDYDTRIVIIGNRCFGMRRWCRKGDFRASGSGVMSYAPEMFDKKIIKEAFAVAKNLRSQAIYFDFVSSNNKPYLIEISYCSKMEPYDNCPGYWDENLNWNKRTLNLQEYMMEDFINSIIEFKNKYS